MTRTAWFCRSALTLIVFVAVALRVSGTVFTANTAIGPFNTNYDGQDIVISNCILTVDGAHDFSSLVVATNGILTHSAAVSGELSVTIGVTNAPYVLNGTVPDELASSNVFTPLLVTDESQTIIYTNGVDYLEIEQTNGSAVYTQVERTTNSSIPDGATVLVSYSYYGMVPVGLNLMVTGTVWVANGGMINADAIGFGPGSGPGAGSSSSDTFFDGSGGGDGGSGGTSLSNAVGGVCYDSLYQPALPGSGGGASYAGNGGNGGGLIQITAGGNLEIDGIISANGQNATNSRAGGGSGGGIWISAPSVSGSGSITANGGSGAPGHGGGGGGGRIAIVCGTNDFSGTIATFGGGGANYGGAGTIFTQLTGQNGLLTLNNGGNTGASSTVTLSNIADVLVSGNAVAAVPPLSGTLNFGNLTIGSNSAVTALGPGSLYLYSFGNLTIQAGGAISADGSSYPNGGNGLGGSTYSIGGIVFGGGGGHAGIGGAASITNATGGSAYDSASTPIYLGSAGGGDSITSFGGTGGGLIHVYVFGVLQVNGRISANGANGSGNAGGGGSGGTVSLDVGTLSGDGVITANGGNGVGSLGGGGGGGCISIAYFTNNFSGPMTAYGGGGANYGGAGTVYSAQNANYGQLILDNGGNTGAATPLVSSGNLIVQNGALASLANGSSFFSLLVGSNAWVTAPPTSEATTVNITGSATFAAGGGLNLNADGSANSGYGAGAYQSYAPYAAGGGGNAGMGGVAETNVAAGGSAGFNTVANPLYAGGNGGGYAPYSIGGIGGGAMKLTVGETLQVNGVISANGGNGYGAGGGGGAGGSLTLSVGTLAGSGSITANGGTGAGLVGGGGGGGCLAITFNSNLFVGTLAAVGGIGANAGGAGTIYFKTNSAQYGQVIVDNGGLNGAYSVVGSPSAYTDLTLRNSGILYYGSSSLSFGNVLITNASLVVSNFPVTITANNFTLQNGGRFSANAAGYAQNTGPDAGRYNTVLPFFPGGGGGNGGCGGMAISNTAAGGAGAFQPYYLATEAGSGGGGYLPYSVGGSGGGVIELTVSGLLNVNGTLSANGGNGSGSGGGGGAGGSLDLNVAGLTGSGVISANGGNGANNVGGGGGGGMIAVNFTSSLSSNSFAGTLSAYGGAGATNGGAGTIFLKTNYTSQATLIVDNGGNLGTNTPITTSSSLYALMVRNGGIAAIQPSSESFSSLLVTSNAWLVPYVTQQGQIGEVYLNLSGNATVQAGGGIIANSFGSAQSSGTGHGSSYAISPTYPCSGGGHGGDGAFGISNLIAGGGTYDSITGPNQAGSGGGDYLPYSTGGAGGGIVYLTTQTGAIQVNGMISANGGNGSGIGGGGGSGGAINLMAASITGTGSITANGGAGAPNGGGGGGGCISLDSTAELRTNLFLGTVSAYGGGGANYGGAGTIYYQTNNFLTRTPLLYLDNDDNFGTDTTLSINPAYVTIQNGAIGAIPTSTWTPGVVLVLTNGELTSLVGQTTVHATSMTIAGGGVFSVDGEGYATSSGPGAGSASGGIGGGGGHGGYGGGNAGSGGGAYDSIQAPAAEGSGGASSSTGVGGAGGGALNISVTQGLVVDGVISANGRPGGFNAGGGAGGSVYFSSIFNGLSGSGIISAKGGAGSGSGGGGGGGRIYSSYSGKPPTAFTGQYIVSGGGGVAPGGAGTVFVGTGSQTLLIDNGGLAGTNTPLSSQLGLPSTSFELDISGGASVVPLTPLPLLSNLNVSAASTLTMPAALSSLSIGVASNATITGDLDVDDLGYSQAGGPGAGSTANNEGSGAGYGGAGGASGGGAAGGMTYGTPAAPTDFGSGGGTGAATTIGGSAGGGALRLSVLGTLTVNGNVSANGDTGLQDDSGGGSGGSVWITAGTLAGTGTVSASGGDGVLYGGGGGGGGRIAIYAANNQFTGTTNVAGGTGSMPGLPGTVLLSSIYNGLQVLSQSPTGLVQNTVSSVNLNFSDMLNPATVSASDFTLVTPAGTLSASDLSAAVTGPYSVQLSFPTQNLNGTYTVEAAATIMDMFGTSLPQPYSGTFTVSLPTISGTVTDTNGAGVAGVALQPSGGLTATTTDSSGNYSLGVPPGWTGTVTPSFGTYAFVPGSLSYTNVASSLPGQNYLMVQTIAPGLTTSLSAGNFSLNWNGISGVTYQVLWSTNLITWQPLGSPIPGTNGSMQVVLPTGSNAAEFFELQAGD